MKKKNCHVGEKYISTGEEKVIRIVEPGASHSVFSVSQEGTRLLIISTDQDTCSALVLEAERKSASLVIAKFSGLLNIS